jgi:hypothetical protein
MCKNTPTVMTRPANQIAGDIASPKNATAINTPTNGAIEK